MPVSLDFAGRTHRITEAVVLRATGASVELLSGACRICEPCRLGLPDHCAAPVDHVVQVSWRSTGEGRVDEPDLTAWGAVLRTVDQLSRCGRTGSRVGVVGSGTSVRLVRDCLASAGVQVLVAQPRGDVTPDELRRLSSALRTGAVPAGPPDVVVAVDGDLSLAAKLVRRGGCVLASAPSPAGVPLTALVQRELTLVPTYDIAGSAADSPLLRSVGGWVRQGEGSHG